MLNNILKKFFLFLYLTFCNNSVYCADWVSLELDETFAKSGETKQIYVDLDSVDTSDNLIVSEWVKFLNKVKNPSDLTEVHTKVFKWLFDCKNKKLSLRDGVFYNSRGGVIRSLDPDYNWDEVIPDSTGELLYNFSCDIGIRRKAILSAPAEADNAYGHSLLMEPSYDKETETVIYTPIYKK